MGGIYLTEHHQNKQFSFLVMTEDIFLDCVKEKARTIRVGVYNSPLKIEKVDASLPRGKFLDIIQRGRRVPALVSPWAFPARSIDMDHITSGITKTREIFGRTFFNKSRDRPVCPICRSGRRKRAPVFSSLTSHSHFQEVMEGVGIACSPKRSFSLWHASCRCASCMTILIFPVKLRPPF